MADEYAMTHFDSAIALVVRKGCWLSVSGDGAEALKYGRERYTVPRQDFIKDGLDNDMTAKKRILAFEIGTFFTRYVVFEDGRMGIPGTIATPVDGEEPFYQALAHIVSKQRALLTASP